MKDLNHDFSALAQYAVGAITYGVPVAGVKATGSITFGAPDNGDTVVVDGNTFTKVAAAPGAGEFTNIAELEALVEAVAGVNSSENGTVISVVAASRGVAGNAITLALGVGNTGTMAISGATLTGGVDSDTVAVDGNTFSCVDSAPGANEFSSIAELEALVEAIAGLNSTQDGSVISITADAPGAAGNAVTLALGGSNAGTMAVSGATLTGGVDASYTDVLELTGEAETANEVDVVIVLSGKTGTAPTLTVTPQVSLDKVNWIDRTASAALSSLAASELHVAEALTYFRCKLVVGGTGSPTVSGSIRAVPSQG